MTSSAAATALDALSAWSTFGTGVIALVAVVAAFVVGRDQVKEARAARDLTKRLDIERSQPYVVAYMEPSEASEQIINLVVKNFGQTAARDIRIQIDPWPERSKMPEQFRLVGFPTPLPILAPGQEWKTVWDTSPQRRGTDLPDRHDGVLIYDGLEGQQIETPVVLDWTVFKSRMHTEIRTQHHAAKSLYEIERSLKGFRSGLHGSVDVTIKPDDGESTTRRSGFADPAFFFGPAAINDPSDETDDEQPS
jgi:hypothetical protein